MPKKSTHHRYLNDLEVIYRKSLKNKNFSTAIKVKELQEKERGKSLEKEPKDLVLKNLNPENIQRILESLEQEHPEDIKHVKKEIALLKRNIKKRNELRATLNKT